MQLTPLETHLSPLIAIAHEELDVNSESVHYFTLQRLDVVAGVVAVAVVVVMAQKHTPSVPWTQLTLAVYDPQVEYGMQAVPDVVQGVEAENTEQPRWVDILVALEAVASEHYYNLQVPVVAVPEGAT